MYSRGYNSEVLRWLQSVGAVDFLEKSLKDYEAPVVGLVLGQASPFHVSPCSFFLFGSPLLEMVRRN